MEIKLKLRPFIVPNFVVTVQAPANRGDGYKEPVTYPLSALDSDTLGQLCDEFRRGVFAQAGKADNAPLNRRAE